MYPAQLIHFAFFVSFSLFFAGPGGGTPAAGAETPATAVTRRVVVLGDSLTEGYGLPKESAYPALLQKKFLQAGITQVEIINAGISGSTSASGESRLRWHLKAKPEIVLLALGANDGLRGLPLAETRKNLSKVIELARSSGVKVLLAGMKMPPNYGREYTEGYEKLYQDLARQYGIPLIPFLLEGVAGEKSLNLEDGIHPNEQGQRKLAETVYPHLLKILQTTGKAKS